jgi:xanthosine utilization system XapX-like protein
MLLITIYILEWPVTLLGLLGMYFGIQISHPVYSILFENMSISFAGTEL